MPTMSEQAGAFATRATGDWWEDRVRTEFRYTLRRVRSGNDPAVEWPRLQQRLESLTRLKEQKAAA